MIAESEFDVCVQFSLPVPECLIDEKKDEKLVLKS